MSATRKPRRWRRPTAPARPGDAPAAWLSTRYGSLRLDAHAADHIVLSGPVDINNADHTLTATLCRRDARSPFHLGDDHDDPRSVVERAGLVDLRRGWSKPAASVSAREKAAIEIDRVVNEWAATAQARTIMRQAARHGAAKAAWLSGIKIGEALARERQAQTERLQAVRALWELTPSRDPRYSPLSPAEAIRIYQARLTTAIEAHQAGNATVEETHKHLLALATLTRPDAGRAHDPLLWDALTALLEATEQ
jgi:hypothetical protein